MSENNIQAKVFIGSSTKALKYAKLIQDNLDKEDLLVDVWDDGVFRNSETLFGGLDRISDEYDFGIFIFTPDDLIQGETKSIRVARANVVFEFGLFVGRKGPERTFLVSTENTADFVINADLSGVYSDRFDPNSTEQILSKTLRMVSRKINTRIKEILSSQGFCAESRLERVISILNDAAKGMATISLGRYPHFYGELNKLLAESEKKINIACDYVNYGMFSANEEYKKYINIIKGKNRKTVDCFLIYHAPQVETEVLSLQFATNELEWDKACSDAQFALMLERFQDFVDRPIKTREDFLREFQEKQDATRNFLLETSTIEFKTIPRKLPLYLWIVDEQAAVFSIPRFGSGHDFGEHGLYTRDTNLVRTLQTIWQQYWKEGTEVKKQEG